jgi:hypothetical protein
MRVLPSANQTASATDTIRISWLNPFTCVAAQYPIPLASLQPVTRLGARFSSEVVANLSSGWIFTKLDIIVFLGALGKAFLFKKRFV